MEIEQASVFLSCETKNFPTHDKDRYDQRPKQAPYSPPCYMLCFFKGDEIYFMQKKILYLDMDGVVADFDKAIETFIPDLHTSDDYLDYETRSAKVDSICESNPDFFHNLPPIIFILEQKNTLIGM